MRRSVGMLLLVCLLIGSRVSAQENKTLTVRSLAEAPSFAKRALVIGIGQYEHAGSLAPATYNDAASFADLLKTRFGFPDEAITLLTDAPGTPESRRPTYIHLRNAFQTLLAGINEKSEVIVYFSGHGTRAEDHDWLVPLDGLPSDVDATCINYDEFKSQLNTKTPARALLIVDACRNLSGGKDAGSSGFGAGKGLSGPQFAELLACRPKEESKVGKPEDFSESVFTHFLLQGLQGDRDAQDNGVVTFDSLNEYVQGRVSQYVSSKYGESQNPEGRASLGKMVLVKTTDSPAKPVAGSPEKRNRVVGRRLTGAVRPAEAQAGDVWVNPKDGAEMVYIPAGPFQMGDDDMYDNRRHTVTLSGYWIYKNVVTVGQYKKFCRETGRRMPSDPGGYNIGDTVIAKFNPDWSKEDNPMVDVSWEDATAYSQWAGVALPTEAQWEKAARGTDGRKYPWGDAFDLSKVWCSRKHMADAGGTTAVGEYGISPYGCTDMSGNVQQWCLDRYDENFWSRRAAAGVDPVNLAGDDQAARVIRGCDWLISPDVEIDFRTASRSSFLPANINDGIGFRCASGK